VCVCVCLYLCVRVAVCLSVSVLCVCLCVLVCACMCLHPIAARVLLQVVARSGSGSGAVELHQGLDVRNPVFANALAALQPGYQPDVHVMTVSGRVWVWVWVGGARTHALTHTHTHTHACIHAYTHMRARARAQLPTTTSHNSVRMPARLPDPPLPHPTHSTLHPPRACASPPRRPSPSTARRACT